MIRQKNSPSSSIPLIRPIDKSPGRNNENITLLVDGYLDYLHRLLLIGGHGKLSPKTTATSFLVIVARRITLYTFSVFSPAVLVTSSSSTQILVRIFIIILVDQASIPRGCFTFFHIHPLYIHTYSTWPATTTTAPRRIHIYTILLLSSLSSPGCNATIQGQGDEKCVVSQPPPPFLSSHHHEDDLDQDRTRQDAEYSGEG